MGMDSKLFPAPGFQPAIGVLRLEAGQARLIALTRMTMPDGSAVSGLPLPPGALGNTGEIALFDDPQRRTEARAPYHANGLDTEAIAYDAGRGLLWVADEYGPFLMRVDPVDGRILQRYAPGSGLPAVLALRRANRGIEGMTLDPESGRIHAFLQSPLNGGNAWCGATGREEKVERYARFVRWVQFDPDAGVSSAMYAYPLDPAGAAPAMPSWATWPPWAKAASSSLNRASPPMAAWSTA